MTITKEELERKYRSMKNEDLASELGVSVVTLLKLLDESGIERKGSGNAYHRDRVRVIK